MFLYFVFVLSIFFIFVAFVVINGMPPPACNHTGTAFCFPNEEEAEMRRMQTTDDVSL